MRYPFVAAVLFLPSAALAQAIRITPLAPPSGRLDHEVTRVESVRGLKDGRGLVVIDFRNGSVVDVSHKGRGPGEYARAGTVYGLAADSSVMSDNANRRWLLLHGDRVVATIPPDDPAVLAAAGIVSGADTSGHVLPPRP